MIDKQAERVERKRMSSLLLYIYIYIYTHTKRSEWQKKWEINGLWKQMRWIYSRRKRERKSEINRVNESLWQRDEKSKQNGLREREMNSLWQGKQVECVGIESTNWSTCSSEWNEKILAEKARWTVW